MPYPGLQILQAAAGANAGGGSEVSGEMPTIGRFVFDNTANIAGGDIGNSNTTGTWSQTDLGSPTDADIDWLLVSVTDTYLSDNGDAIAAFMDIAIGSPASEVPIISSIAMGGLNRSSGILLPIHIPAGSIISNRLSSSNATHPLAFFARFIGFASGNGVSSPTELIAVGATPATNTGIAVGDVDTWHEITASTSDNYRGFVPTWQLVDASTAASVQTVDVGIGGSGSEVLTHRSLTTYSSSEDIRSLFVPYLGNIPSGSRLAARGSNGALSNIQVVLQMIPEA